MGLLLLISVSQLNAVCDDDAEFSGRCSSASGGSLLIVQHEASGPAGSAACCCCCCCHGDETAARSQSFTAVVDQCHIIVEWHISVWCTGRLTDDQTQHGQSATDTVINSAVTSVCGDWLTPFVMGHSVNILLDAVMGLYMQSDTSRFTPVCRNK